MSFNPFDKPLTSIQPEDLDVLIANKVAEGYSVEYKSIFPSSLKIARSIASFANTVGGWYIVGVASDPHTHEATAIDGFDSADFPDPIAKVRDSVKSNTQPVPVFYARLFQVAHGMSVLVVEVPEDQATPFITSDGRIYRRVSDASEPLHEKDRYALDRLVDRGWQPEEAFDAFCEDPRQFDESETQGWLRLFIDPRFATDPSPRSRWLTTSELAAILAEASAKVAAVFPDASDYMDGSISFQSAQLTPHSVILGQLSERELPFNPLEVELFGDGRFRLLIPLPIVRISDPNDVNRIASQEVRSYLHRLASSENSDLLTFFDMRKVWVVIALTVSFYQGWLSREFSTQLASSPAAWARLMLGSVWRHVPLIDSARWASHVAAFQLPVIRRDSITAPDPLTGTTYLELAHDQPYWFLLAGKLAISVGLPVELITAAAFPDTHWKNGASKPPAESKE